MQNESAKLKKLINSNNNNNYYNNDSKNNNPFQGNFPHMVTYVVNLH